MDLRNSLKKELEINLKNIYRTYNRRIKRGNYIFKCHRQRGILPNSNEI